MDIKVCTVIIDDIRFTSPPSCLAKTNDDGAVGRTENIISIDIIWSSKLKAFATKNIIIGVNISFEILALSISFLDDLISFITNPNPTDKRPRGNAAELIIDKVFSIIIGTWKPEKLIIPPIKHAIIKGFVIIDFIRYLKVSLFWLTYNAKVEIHKILIKGITNVNNIAAKISPSSPNIESAKAKNT